VPDLATLRLSPGSHNDRDDGVCATEFGAWMRAFDYDPCPNPDPGWHTRDCDGGCFGWHVVNLRPKPGLEAPPSHTDHPPEICPVIGAYLRRLNDSGDQALRDRLQPYTIRALGTGDDGHQTQRGYLAADFAVRTALPVWLEL